MNGVGAAGGSRVMRLTGLLLALCVLPARPSVMEAQQRPAPSAAQGWRFSYTITPTVSGSSPAVAVMQADVSIWRGRARVTVRQGPVAALTGEGGYLLLRADDGSLAVVDPTRREVLRSIAGDIGAMLSGPFGNMPVSDVRSTSGAVTDGAPAFGFPTREVTLQQAYVISLPPGSGGQRSLRTEQTTQLTLSRGVEALDPAFAAVAEQVLSSLATPGAIRKALRTVQRRVPRGFPVRSVTTATTVAGGDTIRTVTRSALTDLRRDAMDTTAFVLPAGYRVTEMSRLLQQSPRRP